MLKFIAINQIFLNLENLSSQVTISLFKTTFLPAELNSAINFIFGKHNAFYAKTVLAAAVLLSAIICLYCGYLATSRIRDLLFAKKSGKANGAIKEQKPKTLKTGDLGQLAKENMQLRNEIEGISHLWEITSGELAELRKKHRDLLERTLTVTPLKKIDPPKGFKIEESLPPGVHFIEPAEKNKNTSSPTAPSHPTP
jgi:hypothetical protein